MNAAEATQEIDKPGASSVLRTLVLCDLVNSTALVERLGDRLAAELIRKHDRLARTIADRHGGREVDKTDGFLMMFERPIQAVGFALDYQRGLRQLNAVEDSALSARVGVHVGEVIVWDNTLEDIARGAKLMEVEGLVKPVALRLMGMALPGQILLSGNAYSLAHRAQGELSIPLEKIRWRSHGRYRFRGIVDAMPVFEIGEEGLAPLKAPAWSSKAYRERSIWHRPAIIAIQTVLVAALLSIPLYMFLRPEPAIAFAQRDWVVVGSLNNLTDETVFDGALESALRISLEQSRYVNVLPDLKVRDTLKRMQRDPDQTRIDLAIGSELAIRDGARALILPTIAEVDGRVRITAEIVDPRTKTTIYSESADGVGVESVLPSLDTINSRMRLRLGEALATVSNDSRPLEKVTTPQLDALRIYSQGIRMLAIGNFAQASVLLHNAIELDPDFARAHIELATIQLTSGERSEALEHLNKAKSIKDRLSARDRLMLEALLADFASPHDTLAKWQALVIAYPDSSRAQGAYGYYAWHYANDYDAAIEATRHNISAQNPDPGAGHYLLGTLLLGMEEYSEAHAQFVLAEKSGMRYENNFYASSFAAQRRYERIDSILAKGRPNTNASNRTESMLGQISYTLDQGRWTALEALLVNDSDAQQQLLNADQRLSREEARLAVRSLIMESGARQRLAFAVDDALAKAMRADPNFDPKSWNAHLLFRAWLAARSGNTKVARLMLGQTTDLIRDDNHPALKQMRIVVEAELARADGNYQQAESLLRAQLDGKEPFATHVALMDVAKAAGNFRAAREQARWLATHRGRAYSEVSSGIMVMPFNVGMSNLALLVAAECSVELKEWGEARKWIAEYRAAWPDGGPPSTVKLMQRIESALDKAKDA